MDPFYERTYFLNTRIYCSQCRRITLLGEIMKRLLITLSLSCISLVFVGCVSGVMTASTGKKLEITSGDSRLDIISKLGAPTERRTDISPQARKYFSYSRKPIVFAEIFEYKGKINSSDEGAGEAMIGTLTLGVSEIFMIPATAVSIAKRSKETNRIYVFFDDSDQVVAYMINPTVEYQGTASINSSQK